MTTCVLSFIFRQCFDARPSELSFLHRSFFSLLSPSCVNESNQLARQLICSTTESEKGERGAEDDEPECGCKSETFAPSRAFRRRENFGSGGEGVL